MHAKAHAPAFKTLRWMIFLSLLTCHIALGCSYFLPNVVFARVGLSALSVSVLVTALTWSFTPNLSSMQFDSLEKWMQELRSRFLVWPMPMCWMSSIFGRDALTGLSLSEGRFQRDSDKGIKTFLTYQFTEAWTILPLMAVPFYWIWTQGLYGVELRRLAAVSELLNDILVIFGIYAIGMICWWSSSIFLFRVIAKRKF